MRVCRSRLTRNFTVVPNEPVQSVDLSLLAAGLLAYLLSLPDGRKVTIRGIAEDRPEGRIRISKAMHELEEHGYRRCVREQDERGRWRTVLYVYDCPYTEAVDGVHAPTDAPGTPKVPAQRAVPVPPKAKRKDRRAAKHQARAAAELAELAERARATPEHAQAVRVLAGLNQRDARLTLSAHEVLRLAPAAAARLADGVSGDALAAALSASLPEWVHAPAAFLARRLETMHRAAVARPVATRPDGVPLPAAASSSRNNGMPDEATCRFCGQTFPPRPGRPDTCTPCYTSPRRDERNQRGITAVRAALHGAAR